MHSHHQVAFGDAREMRNIEKETVDLVVTSPPYPMVEMWDATFTTMNPSVAHALDAADGPAAFELMHRDLDEVWRECIRVLKPGGTICINIGDAVRTIAGDFQMHSNHARVTSAMGRLGMTQLPDVLWRKPTNAPNKFLGSGMLPVGAYVTYEHEYILIFRKGRRRLFKEQNDKQNRRASAFFWEERNCWFSDLWVDLKGITQKLADTSPRDRSAAYPFELAYRLICMHSVYGDTILDPFLGTGTTAAAAIAACRNSTGIEIDNGLYKTIKLTLEAALTTGAKRVTSRLCEHQKFVNSRCEAGLTVKHRNRFYGFPVMTSQETDILLYKPCRLKQLPTGAFHIDYKEARGVTEDTLARLGLFAAQTEKIPLEEFGAHDEVLRASRAEPPAQRALTLVRSAGQPGRIDVGRVGEVAARRGEGIEHLQRIIERSRGTKPAGAQAQD